MAWHLFGPIGISCLGKVLNHPRAAEVVHYYNLTKALKEHIHLSKQQLSIQSMNLYSFVNWGSEQSNACPGKKQKVPVLT